MVNQQHSTLWELRRNFFTAGIVMAAVFFAAWVFVWVCT
jgi:hypothetical protein